MEETPFKPLHPSVPRVEAESRVAGWGPRPDSAKRRDLPVLSKQNTCLGAGRARPAPRTPLCLTVLPTGPLSQSPAGVTARRSNSLVETWSPLPLAPSPGAPRDPACSLRPFATHSSPALGSGAPLCLCAGSGLYWGWQGGPLGDHLVTSCVSAELVGKTGSDEQRERRPPPQLIPG